MNMIIKCGLQFHYFWFKQQDLRYANVENGANLGSILKYESHFITLMKRLFVTGDVKNVKNVKKCTKYKN